MDPIILAALKAALTSSDIKGAIESLLSELEAAAPPPSSGDVSAADGAPAVPAGDDKKEAAADPAGGAPAPAAGDDKKEAADGATKEPYSAAVSARFRELEDAQRDQLVAANKGRMVPSVAKWAAKQPLAIARSFIASLPPDGTARVTASSESAKPTLGQGQAKDAAKPASIHGVIPKNSLSEEMGFFEASSETARREPDGRFILPTITPSRVREIAANQKGK